MSATRWLHAWAGLSAADPRDVLLRVARAARARQSTQNRHTRVTPARARSQRWLHVRRESRRCYSASSTGSTTASCRSPRSGVVSVQRRPVSARRDRATNAFARSYTSSALVVGGPSASSSHSCVSTAKRTRTDRSATFASLSATPLRVRRRALASVLDSRDVGARRHQPKQRQRRGPVVEQPLRALRRREVNVTFEQRPQLGGCGAVEG